MAFLNDDILSPLRTGGLSPRGLSRADISAMLVAPCVWGVWYGSSEFRPGDKEYLADRDLQRVGDQKKGLIGDSILCGDREALLKGLAEKDIYCGKHYPIPIHLQEAYQSLGYKKGDFPVAERCAEGQMSLPMFPELTEKQIEYVAQEIKCFLAS